MAAGPKRAAAIVRAGEEASVAEMLVAVADMAVADVVVVAEGISCSNEFDGDIEIV